jgi:4-amino-4-deoxy-L-arabinose transferase-like glycosyltransferase
MTDRHPFIRSGPRAVAAAIMLAGFAAMLAVNFPGHLEFDSIRQLLEGRARVYSNWHPPIMSWLLGIADAIEPGAAPFFIFDAALAFGSILSLLWLSPRPSWAGVVVAVLCVVLPQLFLFQAIVWKDMLFADACLAGFVCLAHAAVQWNSRNWRLVLLFGAAVFLALAVLTRQSGAVILPCAATAVGMIAARVTTWRRGLFHSAGFLLA